LLAGIPVLALTSAKPAETLVTEGPIPRKASGDAVHIAVATAYACEYLLTWNCRQRVDDILIHPRDHSGTAALKRLAAAVRLRPWPPLKINELNWIRTTEYGFGVSAGPVD